MAFSFELKLAISSELYGAISAGPEQAHYKRLYAVLGTPTDSSLFRHAFIC